MNTQKRLIREAVYKLQQIVFLIGVPPVGSFAVIIQQRTKRVKRISNMFVIDFTQYSLILHSEFTHKRSGRELYYGWHKEALF